MSHLRIEKTERPAFRGNLAPLTAEPTPSRYLPLGSAAAESGMAALPVVSKLAEAPRVVF